MTRILVVGLAEDDPTFVHNKLCEVNRIYGPVTCVIHSNNAPALAWQQWISRRQPQTRHLPIVEDMRYGLLAGQKCRDKLFEAKPDYVVVIREADAKARGENKKTQFIIDRAERDSIPVLVYEQYQHHDREVVASDELDGIETHKTPAARLGYMREYMRKRRVAGQSAGAVA